MNKLNFKKRILLIIGSVAFAVAIAVNVNLSLRNTSLSDVRLVSL